MTARLDLALHERQPFAPGPYKLTLAEGATLNQQVRDSMPSEKYRRLTVLELLDLYQQQKQKFLLKAAVREPLRFAAKGLS